MTVYTASFFEPRNHHGKVISISRVPPKGITIDGDLEFFKPSQKLLTLWKYGAKDEAAWDGYKAQYKAETIVPNLNGIYAWIDDLDTGVDITLCCWEKTGDYCHRNLVALLIQQRRMEIWGGSDIGCDRPNKFSYLGAMDEFISISNKDELEAWRSKYAETCAYADFWQGRFIPVLDYERIRAIRDGRPLSSKSSADVGDAKPRKQGGIASSPEQGKLFTA